MDFHYSVWLRISPADHSVTITIAVKYEVHTGFRLTHLQMTFTSSKGNVKVMHISTEYLLNGPDWANIAIAIKYNVACGLSISIFKVDLGLF